MAATNNVLIRNLSTAIKPCTITVRILRVWKQPIYGDVNNIGSMEMILMDEEGDRVQASVRKNLMKTFEHLLVEGEIRKFTNFFVNENVGSYKILDTPVKIMLHKLSSVKVCEQFEGPVHGFMFVSFRDILDEKVENNQTIDVIGHISGCADVVIGEKNGLPNKRLDVQLQDLDGIKVKCTFWDAYVDEFKSKFDEENCDVNVMVIQFGKLREWRGNYTISHGFHVARLLINNDIPEINEFKQRFVDTFGYETAKLKAKSLGDPATEAFFSKSRCIKLDDLDVIYEPTSCVAVVTIKSIGTDQSWYYLACRKCNKKVTTKNPDVETEDVGSSSIRSRSTHDCPECGPDVPIIPRFKVQTKVTDDYGEASLVFFDRDVIRLIMKSAHSLVDKCAGVEAYPDDLEGMIGKKVMVKFQITPFNLNHNYQVYTVSRMTESDIMFKAFYKLAMIETEFQSECDKAKAAETYADAIEATNTILGIKVGSSDAEISDNGASGSGLVVGTTDASNICDVVADPKVDVDLNNDAGVDGNQDGLEYTSPVSNKRCVETLEEDKRIQHAPKKPRKKSSNVQK